MKFFVINNNNVYFDDIFAYGEKIDAVTGDPQFCNQCGSPIGMRKWLPPFNVELSKASYGDFVFGGFVTFLASENFKEKYSASELTGIHTFDKVDIKKVGRKKQLPSDIPNYYHAIIPVSYTLVNEKKSKYKRKKEIKCEYCKAGIVKSMKGVYIDESTWSGDDIFLPLNLRGTLVVTERFKEFVEENKFTNIELIPAEKFIPSWVL